MKIFAFIVLGLMILCFIIIPGAEEYNKHKDGTKTKALFHALIPLWYFIGTAFAGFVLFEIIPRIGGRVIENIFR
jgi:hypothetical protein